MRPLDAGVITTFVVATLLALAQAVGWLPSVSRWPLFGWVLGAFVLMAAFSAYFIADALGRK